MMQYRKHRNRALVGVVMISLLLTSLGGAWAQSAPSDTGRGPAAFLLPQERQIIDIVKRVSATVVAVTTYGEDGKPDGVGSGVIVSRDGDVLTNNHVISGVTEVKVTLADGRELPATSLGGDPSVDLAFVKINANNLPVAPLGDSDYLQVGQIAIAIGNPYGFERTVSVGVVSALRRSIPDSDESLQNLIQTDAQISPGNSGGPLVDSRGQVIGINTAVVAGRSGALGFAIPINTARDIMRQVRAQGRIIIPWIGISYGEINPQIAREFGLAVKQGLIIAGVEKGGPAAEAGLRRGDIITSVDGKNITASGDLRKAIRAKSVGSQVSIEAIRDGKPRNFVVTIREMPARLRESSG
ncbi:MAG: trypsin-like peptidase domain-containing protein [Armatimonadetes bacterium]|nr:trypsin-like peptidase domain-containing protein [Armatimonadota bacterium]